MKKHAYLQLLRRRMREELEAVYTYIGTASFLKQFLAHDGVIEKIAECEKAAAIHVVQLLCLSLLFQSQQS
jgi:hypothetical protein